MKLGRVIGTVVATIRAKGTEGLKLLVVQPLTADLRESGGSFVATDASAQAGPGDLVTWEASREAALLHDPWFVPVDHAIVGIVDQHAHEEPPHGAPEHAVTMRPSNAPGGRLPGSSEGGAGR
jgi:ethanolamine utilization protein EutN